ncbi:TetR/AcrR family transcriptional regulator [Nocardiopsis sp. FIRDI 009]|uniref:TetR/AcrR family transcriptional regulator n=1 Tax=Nocardiopsis sp. FIRDI 009 TaxID=714197 RepID=UPI000E2537D1|nr:TetR/AcrR family transcriptional regulator [Nocardiopsis sp. FIRDI 009]
MTGRQDTRARIVTAAAELLSEGGRGAVTTRAVSQAAGVQPPAIYRQFGDMDGLLDAVAAAGFGDYLARKQAQEPSGDPVADLRSGWDLHVAFGLDNPAFYSLMYGRTHPRGGGEAAAEAWRILVGMVTRVAEAGRLTLDVEGAAAMIHSAAVGVTLTLIDTAPERRDPGLSGRMRDLVVDGVTDAGAARDGGRVGSGDRAAARHAVALGAVLDTAAAPLTPGERMFLRELLDRLARAE